MSYFNEVEFEMPKEDPGENPRKPKELVFNPDKLTSAVNKIKDEFNKIRSGESDLTTYAIDPGNFGFPTGNRLSMFHKNPTKKNLTGFIEIAKQDLGLKAAKHFAELISEAMEKNNE